MALAEAVQNGKRPSQLITWTDQDGDAVDLTGATVTAKVLRSGSGSDTSDGTFTVTDAAAGVFRWDYGDEDIAQSGIHSVQFSAAYGTDPTPAKTFAEKWRVREEI